MLKTVFCLLLSLLIAIPAAAEWEMSEFMILAGWPWEESVEDELRAKALAEAGFNTLMGGKTKLELCRKYKLKLIVEKVTPEDASKLSGDPVVWGYWSIDEPYPTTEFPRLAEQVKSFHKADSNHPVYINMLSIIGDFLHDYIDTVHPEILSYDYYQWWWGSKGHLWNNHAGYFALLEEFREAAEFVDIPLICWIEVNANPANEMGGFDPSPPSNNEQKLRQSVFTSLAYGVKGIEWFTSSIMFVKGTAQFNQCGRDVEKINAELKHLGPILIKLQSVGVFHTSPLPRDTREAPLDHWAQIVGEDGTNGLVMGVFKDDSENDYLLIANRDYRHEQQVTLFFVEPVESVEILNKKSGEWLKYGGDILDNKGVIFNIDAGDGELLKAKRQKMHMK